MLEQINYANQENNERLKKPKSRKDKTMLTFRFHSENLKNYVTRCKAEWPKSRVFKHEVLLAAIDVKTRPVLCTHNTMAGIVGQLVSLKPLLSIQWEPDRDKFFYSAHNPYCSTSEPTWLPKTEIDDILRRNRAYLPDGMPYPVNRFLQCYGADATAETLKVLNWLAMLFKRASLEFGDSPSIQANRMIERAGQLEMAAQQQLAQAIAA